MKRKKVSTNLQMKTTRTAVSKLDPKKVSEELERIRGLNGNLLSPRAVWMNSKKRSDLLHRHFTWDDDEAACLWRDEQARLIIRSVEIVSDTGLSVRQWHHVVIDDQSGYMTTREVMEQEETRQQVMDEIARYLRHARKRLSDFKGFAAEVMALDRVIDKLKRT